MVQMETSSSPGGPKIQRKQSPAERPTDNRRRMFQTTTAVSRPIVRRFSMGPVRVKVTSNYHHGDSDLEPLPEKETQMPTPTATTKRSELRKTSSSELKRRTNVKHTTGPKSILKRSPSLYCSSTSTSNGSSDVMSPGNHGNIPETEKSPSAFCYRLPEKERPKLRKAVSFREDSGGCYGFRLSSPDEKHFHTNRREEFV